MKFENREIAGDSGFLIGGHRAAIPYDCTGLNSLAENGVIPAGTAIPSNDENAVGILLNSVRIDENPNGTLLIHGFVRKSKLPEISAEAEKAIKQITFLN